jgi:hypothetical protein
LVLPACCRTPRLPVDQDHVVIEKGTLKGARFPYHAYAFFMRMDFAFM